MTYLDRFFHLTERNTSVRTEIIAGLTTFLSCVSIVVLNPSILSAAGMDIRALFWATAISCAIACVWISLWGNFPLPWDRPWDLTVSLHLVWYSA